MKPGDYVTFICRSVFFEDYGKPLEGYVTGSVDGNNRLVTVFTGRRRHKVFATDCTISLSAPDVPEIYEPVRIS